MWPYKLDLLKKITLETESIQQQLLKVTKSNWCLICDMKFVDETAVRCHFLNVHHRGVFMCKVAGCTHLSASNGDLRMHCLLWHSDTYASQSPLPNNPMAPISIPQLITNPRSKDVVASRAQVDRQKIEADKERKKLSQKDDSVGRKFDSPTRYASAKCNTCHLSFYTELGLNMHRKYHNLAVVLPAMHNMSDIKSVDELKKLLGMSECSNNVEDVGVRDAPNKENESINENVINVINQIQQQPPTSTKFSQHQCANSDFNGRTSVNVPVKMKLPANINGVDDRTNYTPPMNEVQNRPISPSGSIVSISSSESADINESEDSSNEVDIEF